MVTDRFIAYSALFSRPQTDQHDKETAIWFGKGEFRNLLPNS